MIRYLVSIVIIATLWPAGMGWGQSINKTSGKPEESARHINKDSFEKPEDRRETTTQDGFELDSQQGENSITLDNSLKSQLKTKKTLKKTPTSKRVTNKLISPRNRKNIFGFDEPLEKPLYGITIVPQPELIKSEFEQLIEQSFDEQLFTEMDNKNENEELLNKYINLFSGDDPVINNIDKDDYNPVSEKKVKSFVEPQ